MTKQNKQPVIQFFAHSAEEENQYIDDAIEIYLNTITGPHESKLAANLAFHEGPMQSALPKLFELHDLGYVLRTDKYIGFQAGAIDVTFMKPQEQIDSDLEVVRQQAKDAYAAALHARNLAEQERQVEISLNRQRREREAAERAAEQAELEAQRERALAELRAAYTTD